MRFFAVSALATLLPLALAQGSLPPCAESCLTGPNALPSSCSSSDISCICKDNSFVSGVACCVAAQCSGSDVQSAITFAQQLCEGAGVTVATTLPATCSASATATSAPAGGAGATTTSPSGPVGTGSGSGNATGKGNSTLSASATLTATGTTTGTPIASTGGAAMLGSEGWKYEAVLVGAMGAVAAFAL